MLKTYTLLKKEETQLTHTKGTMTFHIRDENGDERTIEGTTFLSEDKIPQGILSDNKREVPLLEDLFKLDIDESIEVEFDAYNNFYNRDLDKTINQVAYDKVMEIQKERKLLYRLTHFFKKAKKVA